MYGYGQNIPAWTDPAVGERRANREPRRLAQKVVGATLAGNASDAVAGLARIAVDQDAARLQTGPGTDRRSDAPEFADVGSGRIFAGYPASGKFIGIEDAAKWRATVSGGGGRLEVSGDCRNDRGRRYGIDHHAQQEISRIPAKEN